jgi:hypothetical protein
MEMRMEIVQLLKTEKSPRSTSTANLCFGSLFLVLDRCLLELFSRICCCVFLLLELSFRIGAAVDSLVLLSGLAGGVGGAVGALILLGLEALDLLLCLGDVL